MIASENAERSSGLQHSDFSLFQTAIMLEDQVNLRTAELQAALRDNERMTHALRTSEERFRSLANQSMIGIVTVEDGRITYTNERFDAVFGYAAGELAGRSPAALVIAEDRAQVAEAMARQLNSDSAGVGSKMRSVSTPRARCSPDWMDCPTLSGSAVTTLRRLS